MEKSPVLVTGAAGFVGRWLVADLLAAGCRVIGLDLVRDPSAPPAQIGPFRLAGGDEASRTGFRYQGDTGQWVLEPCSLVDAEAVRELVNQVRPGTIYHLAAQSSAAASFGDPRGTFAVNVSGTLNLLEAVRALPEAEWPKLLAVGSAEEYGPQGDSPVPLTEDAPVQPVSPYGVSKVTQTLLCQQYHNCFDLPAIATRSFSHTGPGHDPRFAFPSFARQIATAEAGQRDPVLAVGNLSAVRDFLDVRDVIRAYRLLVAHGESGQVYNVCSGHPLTIQEGLEILLAQARFPLEVTPDPDRQRPSDIPYLVGDGRKLRRRTGWSPERKIATTLGELLEWARKELK